MAEDEPQALGLLLVDHGSRREAANAHLSCVGDLVAALAGDAIAVVVAHMELADPNIAEGVRQLVVERGVQRIRVVPYFLSPGRHATEDVPRLVAEAVAPYPEVEAVVAPPLGLHEGLAATVLDRAGLKRGTRAAAATGASVDVGGCTGDPASCTAPFCRRRSG